MQRIFLQEAGKISPTTAEEIQITGNRFGSAIRYARAVANWFPGLDATWVTRWLLLAPIVH